MKRRYDIAIIGGGVVGSSIARELSRSDVKTVLIEAREDLARGASGANSGIVHAGYDPKPGSLMAKYNVKGCAMYPGLAKELGFPYRPVGSLVIAFDEDGMKTVRKLYDRGLENGVPGMKVISGDEAREMEPELSDKVIGALWAASAGIVSPYEATIAFAENAAVNGVEFLLEQPVQAIERTDEGFLLTTPDEQIETKLIINCAGASSGKISAMAGAEEITISERKGEYTLYDRNLGGFARTVIFQTPDAAGKGVLVTPTAEGNLLLGPSSDPIDPNDVNATATTQEGQDKIFQMGRKSTPNLPYGGAITGFAGIRAVFGDDFYIAPSEKVQGLIQVAGICSPGLTSAPAIAEDVAKMAVSELEKLGQEVHEKADWISHRDAIPSVREMSWDERAELCKEDPAYGRIVCRCETVTEGQIRKALRSPIPVYTIDGVKRRCRAGMGRCQGSFCSPVVMKIISEESGIPFDEIRKAGKGTTIAQGKLKEI
ncbi:MAG: FAD-dependent oxidoreductase [Firmicutes bacterium]|nr:FAD-dependent oxidoreductase [Bacillota bacterium]